MRVIIAAIGRVRPGPERDLIDMYRSRYDAVCRPLGLKPLDLLEGEERKNGPDLKAREAARLAQMLPAGAKCVALDERGPSLTSQALSQKLATWRDEGAPATGFVIGGADGLDRDLVAKADLTVSFGAATWPHMLVRVMLAEQIYRAATLLAGHPYHRA